MHDPNPPIEQTRNAETYSLFEKSATVRARETGAGKTPQLQKNGSCRVRMTEERGGRKRERRRREGRKDGIKVLKNSFKPATTRKSGTVISERKKPDGHVDP